MHYISIAHLFITGKGLLLFYFFLPSSWGSWQKLYFYRSEHSNLFVDWRNLVLISFLCIAHTDVLLSVHAGTFQFPMEFFNLIGFYSLGHLSHPQAACITSTTIKGICVTWVINAEIQKSKASSLYSVRAIKPGKPCGVVVESIWGFPGRQTINS